MRWRLPGTGCALTAATSDENVASQQVLIEAGFVLAGVADPGAIDGKRGRRYRRDLTLSGP